MMRTRFGPIVVCAAWALGGSVCSSDKVSELPGYQGGTYSSPDGRASVEISAGALDEEASITITAVAATPQDVVPGTVYEFSPDGLQFKMPARITIAYDEAMLGDWDENRLNLIRIVDDGLETVGTECDAAANTVSGETDHLSRYGVGWWCWGNAHCSNQTQDCGESGIDCGSSCSPCSLNNAAFVSQQVPFSVTGASTFQASVTMRNTGTNSWSLASMHFLGSENPQDNFTWGTNRISMDPGVTVAPGQSYTFSKALTAPAEVGSYNFQWQMLQDAVGWFGEKSANLAITVTESCVDHCANGIQDCEETGKDCGGDCAACLPAVVDNSTLERKLMFGYQGWFGAAGDGSLVNGWFHWSRNGPPGPGTVTVDFWPDTTDYDADELFPTSLHYSDGPTASLYSAYTRKTVVRHMKWLQDYNLDGVFLQRFASELGDPRFFDFRNRVTESVRAGCEQHGRVFAIMYDISGHPEATLVDDLKNDWRHMVDALQVTASPSYLHHRGKPVLAIWGLGFNDRPGTPQQAQELINWFRQGAEAKYQVALIGGVPTNWRTLSGDSKTDPAWADVYLSFDVLSPWTVGRYGNEQEVADFRESQISRDLQRTNASGIDYLPVVFPGFSWHNLNSGPLNQIPRQGGRFIWKQLYEWQSAGCSMIYVAMFDEVDEGTAMYKLAPTASQVPVEVPFVTLDADGLSLPSDWYLKVAREGGRMLRQDIQLTPNLPIQP